MKRTYIGTMALDAVFFALALLLYTAGQGEAADNPEILRAGPNITHQVISGLNQCLDENIRVLQSIAGDKTYAEKLFAAIKKNDRALVTTVLQEKASRCRVAVENLDPDIKVEFVLINNETQARTAYCFSFPRRECDFKKFFSKETVPPLE